MSIIFFGSDDFAAVSLERLIREGFDIRAVVTQPDRPRGRGMNVTFLPVKMLALEQGIPVLQPQDLSQEDFCERLASFEADIFVVIAYGKILPPDVLNMPEKMCVNVHASLLPKYRGAAPIQWAVINGDRETGVTLIKMNRKMDAGPCLAQKKTVIDPERDVGSLRRRLAQLGADCLVECLPLIGSDDAQLHSQDEAQAVYAPKITKQTGHIDWNASAEAIANLVRGLSPRPGAYTEFQGKRLKILQACPVDGMSSRDQRPGRIIAVNQQGFAVACGKGVLQVERVHPESSKAMSARSFTIGHDLIPEKTVLG
ncbi:MAG: methionyl-tRNA formyltransferase [Candidatus Omnitrophota bacterium]